MSADHNQLVTSYSNASSISITIHHSQCSNGVGAMCMITNISQCHLTPQKTTIAQVQQRLVHSQNDSSTFNSGTKNIVEKQKNHK